MIICVNRACRHTLSRGVVSIVTARADCINGVFTFKATLVVRTSTNIGVSRWVGRAILYTELVIVVVVGQGRTGRTGFIRNLSYSVCIVLSSHFHSRWMDTLR